MKQSEEMDIFEWIAFGVERGFCSPAVCSTHDGIPMSDEEEQEFEDGWDPCLHALRILVQD